MAASRLAIALTGLLASGVLSTGLSTPVAADNMREELPASEADSCSDGVDSANVEPVVVPEQLELKADRQFYDSKRKITIAEGLSLIHI